MASLLDIQDDTKRTLLAHLGLLHALQSNGGMPSLDQWLQCARVHCLSKIELYFLQDPSQLRSPLNLRNEAAAVSLLLPQLGEQGHLAAAAGSHRAELLAALREHAGTLWPELASGDVVLSSAAAEGAEPQAAPRGVPAPPGSPAADFEAWARERGVGAAITIASFGALRGCAASRAVAPGEPLLSIPADVLIYEDSVRGTDLGRMLMAIPGLTTDNLLLIFTMIDRHDEDSGWARYWRSLPSKYFTGLSFPQALVAELEGTAAYLELQKGQAHLRAQYEATRPLFAMLLQAYPAFLRAEWFDYEAYLWAAELWYSYAFEVEFPAEDEEPDRGIDGGSRPQLKRPQPRKKGGKQRRAPGGGAGKGSSSSGGGKGPAQSSGSSGGSSSSSSKPVMVPFACHVNHSPWPHCVRYGKVNPETSTLDFPAFRPCQEGQQVYISYGPVPNLKLLCYYGFVVQQNPHDLVPLLLEPPESPLKEQQAAVLEALGLGLEHSLQDGPLSKQLLACLRVIVATSDELEQVQTEQAAPLARPINPENEAQALQTLEAALHGMLEPLQRRPLLGGAGEEAAQEVAGEGPAEQHAAQQQDAAEQQQGRGSALGAPAPAGGAEQQPAEQQQQQQQQACNENGFDADWCMSRHFCRVYVQGQAHILRRSLVECAALRATL